MSNTKIREATAAELESLNLPSPVPNAERWTFVLIEDDEIRGHLCISSAIGQYFGHDTKVWAKSELGASRLWLHARSFLRDKGVTSVNVHIGLHDGHIMRLWEKQGFEPIFLVMRGEI